MKILKALAALALAFTVYNTHAQCSGFNVQIDVSPDTTCVNDASQLNTVLTNQNSTVSWQLPSGQTLVGNSLYTSSAALSDTGRYIATATYGSCVAKDTLYLKIGTRPLAPWVTNNTPICAGDTLTIDILPLQTFPGIGYALYAPWGTKLGSGKITKIPNATSSMQGAFLAVIYDSVGCSSSSYNNVGWNDINTKPPKPTLQADKNPVCTGDAVMLAPSNFPPSYDLVWTDYNGSKSYNQLYMTFNNTGTPGTYRFMLEQSNNGCLSEPDTLDVVVQPILMPTMNVIVNPGAKVGPYAPVMFTANVADAGSAATYQWVKNGANIPGETGTTLSMIASKDFASGDKISLSMNTNNTCAVPSSLNSSVTTMQIDLGVDDINSKDGIRFYPNPVQDKLIVEGAADEQVTVTGINGMQVAIGNRLSKDGDKVIINTVGLPAGVYLLRAGDKAARFTKAE